MEPRSAERGNPPVMNQPVPRSQSWIEPALQPSVETMIEARGPTVVGRSLLQWSHAQPSVETGGGGGGGSEESESREDISSSLPCFNGATLSRAWKP